MCPYFSSASSFSSASFGMAVRHTWFLNLGNFFLQTLVPPTKVEAKPQTCDFSDFENDISWRFYIFHSGGIVALLSFLTFVGGIKPWEISNRFFYRSINAVDVFEPFDQFL
jgi:hypothetical protein